MKVGIVFPGYVHTITEQGKDLYDNFRLIQDYVEEASQCLGVDFYKTCFIISEQERRKPHNFFPLICTWEYALYKLLEQNGLQSTLFLGQDHGFYSALTAAGSITFPDSLYLSSKLAEWYYKQVTDTNVCLRKVEKISEASLKKICEEISAENNKVCIVARYEPRAFFVLGNSPSCTLLDTQLHHLKATSQNVSSYYSFPLGCYAENPEHFLQSLTKIDIKDSAAPLINYTGKLVSSGNHLRKALSTQLEDILYWDKMQDTFVQLVDTGIIMGYAPQLYVRLQENYPHIRWYMFATYNNFEVLQKILTTI